MDRLPENDTPLVSVIVPTRDRPHLLPMALACYRHQTYAPRELIVIDDGLEPANPDAIARAGGRLIRMDPGSSLGNKLNQGIVGARGRLCQRMDDDDWYAPDFMKRLVTGYMEQRTRTCSPSLGGMGNVLFFDLARWELRRRPYDWFSGGTLLFSRADWEECPFRPLMGGEDVWFLEDQHALGARLLLFQARESYVALRHGTHTWTSGRDGLSIDESVREWPLHEGGPESVFPQQALHFYRDLRQTLVAPNHHELMD